MKNLLKTIFVSIAAIFCHTSTDAQELKILTIGNSFTDSLAQYFPGVVESVPGCKLRLEFANHGGCELSRHWSYIENEEQDINCKMYQKNSFKLKEILTKEKWDVVSIQQASHASWNPETYQPYANHIYNYIKKYAPQAEVIIQQTWAYRSDDPRIMPGGDWNFDQPGMYERLTTAYMKLAQEMNLRVIPVGCAVQMVRRDQPYNFVNYDPQLLKTMHYPDLPPQAGSIVGNISWRKDKASGEMKLNRDSIHLNLRGQYLQACVWFALLYKRNASEITFIPDIIGNSDAEFLRKTAQKAVDEFQQVKK